MMRQARSIALKHLQEVPLHLKLEKSFEENVSICRGDFLSRSP